MDQEPGLGPCLDPECAVVGPLVFLLAWGYDDVRASPVDGLFFALTVPLWFGHRVSSAWLAYATPAYRPAARHAAAALRRGPVGHRRGVLRRAAGSRERAAGAADRARGLARRLGLPAGELPFCRAALRAAQPLPRARGTSVGRDHATARSVVRARRGRRFRRGGRGLGWIDRLPGPLDRSAAGSSWSRPVRAHAARWRHRPSS